MLSIVVKMFTISPYFGTTESPYFWLHGVGSPVDSLVASLYSWQRQEMWYTLDYDSIPVWTR